MSVGKRLRKARKAKGLTIDDIKNKSKIKKSYLEALENDNYKRLPGEVYTKVYIRGYAKIVDLDPQEILAEYENEKNGGKKVKEDKEKEQKEVNEGHILNKDSILKAILGIILVLILVLLSYNLFFRSDQNQNNTASNSQQTQIAQQESSDNNSNTNSNETAENNTEENEEINQAKDQQKLQEKENTANNDEEIDTNKQSGQNESENNENEQEQTTGSETNNKQDDEKSNNKVSDNDSNENDNNTSEEEQEEKPLIQEKTKELTIIAEEKSWLQVTVDGELKFQGFINEDENMTHNGTESIRLKIGNGIAVQVEYEGETLGPFGKRGEVIIKEFDLDN